jgi:hypothetical protein
MQAKNIFQALAVAFALFAFHAQAQTQTTLSFSTLSPYHNGQVVYKIMAGIYYENGINPGQPPGGWFGGPTMPFIERLPRREYQQVDHDWDPTQNYQDPPPLPIEPDEWVQLYFETTYYYSLWDFLGTRNITEQEAIAKGANSADINLIKAAHGINNNIIYWEFCISMNGVVSQNYYPNSSEHAASYISKGALELSVNIPGLQGNWVLKVTDSLGNQKSIGLYTSPGPHKITVTDIEAGNVLVALFAVDLSGESNTYYQEAYALVRKNQTYALSMDFAEQTDAAESRYRIGYMGIGQTSQSVIEDLPMQKGKEAMVRVMAYDAYGVGAGAEPQAFKIRISWKLPNTVGNPHSKTFDTKVSGRHTRSGGFDEVKDATTPDPVIPAEYILPGLQIKAELLHSTTGAVLTQTDWKAASVVEPRKIKIHGYQVKPLFGSGVPGAKSNTRWDEEIMPFVRDVFPYSTISYSYKGKITSLALGSHKYNHALTVLILSKFGLVGHTGLNSDDSYVLKLGVMNYRYTGSDVTGMCYWNRPAISISAIHGLPIQETGYILAHEMAHAFGFDHAPSKGVENLKAVGLWFDRRDDDYPYGGGGMAGGWGYANLKYKELSGSTFKYRKYFLSEDAHISENGKQAHWDQMAYIKDRPWKSFADEFYKSRRLSDYNMAKMLTALKIGTPDTSSPFAPPENLGGLETLPGTDTLIFGPAAAHALEEYWYQTHGVRSIHAVNPINMANTPLDIDMSMITVTPQGKIVFSPSLMSSAPPSPGMGGNEYDEEEDDDDPPILIITRMPRLLGLNVSE